MDARVRAAIDIMRRFPAGQLSIHSLSKSVNLSPSRLRQLFSKETGRSPMQYVRQARMQRAQELLQNTFLSVKEVAFSIGVRDVSHFVRDFKKLCGQTPSEFRAKATRQYKR